MQAGTIWQGSSGWLACLALADGCTLPLVAEASKTAMASGSAAAVEPAQLAAKLGLADCVDLQLATLLAEGMCPLERVK